MIDEAKPAPDEAKRERRQGGQAMPEFRVPPKPPEETEPPQWRRERRNG